MHRTQTYNLAISFLDGIGDINAKKLLSFFNSSENIFKAKLKDLKLIPGIGEQKAKYLYASFNNAIQLAEEELSYIYTNDIEFVFFFRQKLSSKIKRM